MVKIDIASVSYVLGILSIVFAFVSPIAGLVLGIIGFRQSKKKKVKESNKLNSIGITLSAIMLVLSIIAIIVGSSGSNLFPIQ